MTALELAHAGPRLRRHAPVAEYDAYLERWVDQPVYRPMLRHARDEFPAHYPDLETWFAAPLLDRVGRERHDGVRSSYKTLGYQARSYLHYPGLSGYAWFDWEWLLAVARHRIWDAPRLAAGGSDLERSDLANVRCRIGGRGVRSSLHVNSAYWMKPRA